MTTAITIIMMTETTVTTDTTKMQMIMAITMDTENLMPMMTDSLLSLMLHLQLRLTTTLTR